MTRVPNAGFAVMAETGAIRRQLDLIDSLALQLEQAIHDLNRMGIAVPITLAKAQCPPAEDGSDGQ